MSEVLEEIREAYRSVGIRLADPAAYGTYYTLRCAGCDRYLGVVGDRLLPGLMAELIEAQRDLYAQSLLGCQCGHQAVATGGSPARWQAPAHEKIGPEDWPSGVSRTRRATRSRPFPAATGRGATASTRGIRFPKSTGASF